MIRQSLQQMKGSYLNGWKSSPFVRFVLFLFMGLLFYLVLFGHLLSPTYDLQEGDRSEGDIVAPRQIFDEHATEKARQDALAKVEDVYTSIPIRNLELVDRIFNKLSQINADEQISETDKVDIYRRYFAAEYEELLRRPVSSSRNLTDLFLEEVQFQLSEQQYRVPEETFYKFPLLKDNEIKEMHIATREIVARLMNERITDAAVPRGKVAELVLASNLNDKTLRELAQEIIRFAITPNVFFDAEQTEEAKDRAVNSVEPIYFEKNEIIVRQGQIITPELYNLLEENDLLRNTTNYWPQFGLLIMVGLFVFIMYMFIRNSEHVIRESNVQLIMFILILAINLAAMKLISIMQTVQFPYVSYLAPVAIGTMLTTILLEIRLALISLVLYSIVASLIFNVYHPELIFDFRYGFVVAIVCFVSIIGIYQASQRSAILRAGIWVSLAACLANIVLILIGPEYMMSEVALILSFSFGSGLLTAILVIGLLPFFEVTFGILSPLKLVELSNPNHPLLRKLLTETPGTYHHSVMVGNLAESAAEAIGADGLLCRVGSFYHDIGKTKRPAYFIENQGNMENPHDHIEPSLSKEIIIAHARDGAEMLREYKMPKQLCDIAEQHHGTTLLGYFYHKALKQQEERGLLEGEEPVKEEDYRYPGPKAQSKEAAIVGIADCVEAAVRSLRNPTVEQIGSMVDKIIKSRLDDNQYNECDLTLKELDIIAKTLKETLLGIFHSRIEYPDLPSAKSMDKSGNQETVAPGAQRAADGVKGI